jgi:hypothetical protein
LVDAVVYAASAAFALWTLHNSFLLTHRVWADFALPAYTAAFLLAVVVSVAPGPFDLARIRRLRMLITLSVFAAAVVVPLLVEVVLRAHRGSAYAQSETLVTEHAARTFVHGHNPYAATFSHGSLAHHPLRLQEHFPYFPLMALFGLAGVARADVAWTDARLFFAVVAVAAAGAALAIWQTTPERRLRVIQALLVLPTAAPFLVTGGDDIALLAILLLALVLAHEGHFRAATITVSVAALIKLTAWPLLLALPVTYAAGRHRGRRRWRAPLAVAVALLPIVVWSPHDFVEDTLLYPVGLGSGGTTSHAPTVGFFVVKDVTRSPLTIGRAVLTIGLLLVATLVGVRFLRANRLRQPADAGRAAGVLLLLLFALAPVGRLGYVSYPVDLLLWSVMLRDRMPRAVDREDQRLSTSACLERTASAAARSAATSSSASGSSTTSLMPPAPSRAGTPR